MVKSTRKHSSGSRAWRKADQLLAYAQNSYPAVDSSSIYCQKTSYYACLLQDLLEQKERLIAQMIQSAQALEEFEIYQSIPGIGASTAALLIGELGDIRRFPITNYLNAFVGIDIRRFNLGTMLEKITSINEAIQKEEKFSISRFAI